MVKALGTREQGKTRGKGEMAGNTQGIHREHTGNTQGIQGRSGGAGTVASNRGIPSHTSIPQPHYHFAPPS